MLTVCWLCVGSVLTVFAVCWQCFDCVLTVYWLYWLHVLGLCAVSFIHKVDRAFVCVCVRVLEVMRKTVNELL